MSSGILTMPGILPDSFKRWLPLTAIEEKISYVAKSSKKRILQINISIFGFSRGAAEARACAHWMHQIFETENGAFTVAGVPARIGFMGIFDTVAAVGLGDVTPVTFGHMAWANGTQRIHPAVEECAHFIALHEQRASFPLESATGRGNIGYPGMHSDVGGGYVPGEQGRAMPSWGRSPQLSQIPLIDMHFAALKAGVPLMTMEEILSSRTLAKSFAIDQRVIQAYNCWVGTNGILPSGIVEFTQAHTEQYLRWRGSLHHDQRSELTNRRFFKDATGNDVADLEEADSGLGRLLRSWYERKIANSSAVGRLRETSKDVVRSFSPLSKLFIDSGKDPLSAHEQRFFELMTEGKLPPAASISLFEDYVHDSRAGFRIGPYHEPERLMGGYARYRNIFLQGSSEGQTYVSANESLKAVKGAVGETVDFFQKLYGFSVNTFKTARQKIDSITSSEPTISLSQSVRNRANEAARIYDAAERAVLQRYVEADKELNRQQMERWN
jgi:hypothetical protein